jgi:hypothetical protein
MCHSTHLRRRVLFLCSYTERLAHSDGCKQVLHKSRIVQFGRYTAVRDPIPVRYGHRVVSHLEPLF